MLKKRRVPRLVIYTRICFCFKGVLSRRHAHFKPRIKYLSVASAVFEQAIDWGVGQRLLLAWAEAVCNRRVVAITVGNKTVHELVRRCRFLVRRPALMAGRRVLVDAVEATMGR